MTCLRRMALRAAPWGAIALTAAAAAQAQTAPALHSRDGVLVLPNVEVRQGPVAREVAGLASTGLRAFKDRDTGLLRPPTPEEQLAIGAEVPEAAEPVVVKRATNGALMARAGTQAMSYSVAQRNAKGEVDTVCVTGEASAKQALARKPATSGKSAGKEHRHDTH